MVARRLRPAATVEALTSGEICPGPLSALATVAAIGTVTTCVRPLNENVALRLPLWALGACNCDWALPEMVKVSALEERSSQFTSRLESTSWMRLSRVTESCRLAGCSDSTHDKLTGLGETIGIATTTSDTGRSTSSITFAFASPVTTRSVVEYWPGGFAFDTRVNTMVTGLAVPWAVTCSQPGSVCPGSVPMAIPATAGLLQVIC